MISFLLLSLLFISGVYCEADDFRLGIQLCDSSPGSNKGAIRYTPWFSEDGGWTEWAGDSNYYDPDGMRIGIYYGGTGIFEVTTADIRLCIQLTDHASDETGNSAKEGDEECTPWASEGGGWSDFACDSNCYDFDAVRIKLDIDDSNPTTITNLRAGLQLTDSGTSTSKKGEEEFTSWKDSDNTYTWSDWAGDSNFYDPDSIRIYLDAQGPSISHTQPIINDDYFNQNHGFNDYYDNKYDNNYNYRYTLLPIDYTNLLIFVIIVILIIVNAFCGCIYYKQMNQGTVQFSDYKV